MVGMAARAEYRVSGMTCDHCVRAVTAEVQEIPGVTDVEIDLDSGSLTVRSHEPIHPDAVRAAVDEAGYELSS